MNGDDRPKMKVSHLFLNRFTYFGLLLILLSVITDLGKDGLAKYLPAFLISLISGVLSTVGVALLVGAVFDLAKNSEEFVTSVSRVLSDIVVSKSFLETLSEGDKRQALELILQPSGDQLQQYSNINQYFQKKIDEMVGMFDTNFKSHLALNVSVYKDPADGIVKAHSTLQYRIYKINNEYKPIQTWFELEDSEFVSTKIICGTKVISVDKEKVKPLPDEDNCTEISYKKTYFEIPKEYQSEPYVTVQYEVLEPGADHWINYTWTSLTPYDGLDFTLLCQGDLRIKNHILFDTGDGYVVNMGEGRKSISILATKWLNSHTGLSIVIGEDTAGEGADQGRTEALKSAEKEGETG